MPWKCGKQTMALFKPEEFIMYYSCLHSVKPLMYISMLAKNTQWYVAFLWSMILHKTHEFAQNENAFIISVIM